MSNANVARSSSGMLPTVLCFCSELRRHNLFKLSSAHCVTIYREQSVLIAYGCSGTYATPKSFALLLVILQNSHLTLALFAVFVHFYFGAFLLFQNAPYKKFNSKLNFRSLARRRRATAGVAGAHCATRKAVELCKILFHFVFYCELLSE